ncbi:hypothetical protein F3Y22_tig00001120pilonHSYRG00198 [Hibiscus syriacus]|uniref:Retrotransposon Copia-like N-terminal domain-containing protein n=1 Tax=Hibiscus syriacus TaxID=106335 RepID=A0A6A3D1D5_HIBSY|nr:hypothetical protein F3Y22_tig00001120pilonHSYRG00198 [Hibiscus syriacus]
MTQLCRKTVRVNTKWIVLERVSVFRRIFSFIWDKVVVCSLGRPIQYRRLTRLESSSSLPSSSYSLVEVVAVDDDKALPEGYEVDSDLVSLKISLLGKYVGDEQEKILQMTVLNLANKTLFVQGAKISFSIWDVGGDSNSLHHLPIACKNAVAIMFMFDLTSRCTLNSVVGWYSQARNWNQTAIPIIIGTKFDDFVGLPPDVQWTIVTQVAMASSNSSGDSNLMPITGHKLNGNNYLQCSHSVMMFICGRRKDDYLKGVAAKPSQDDEKFKIWNSENNISAVWPSSSSRRLTFQPLSRVSAADDPKPPPLSSSFQTREGNPYLDRRNHRKSKGVVGVSVFREASLSPAAVSSAVDSVGGGQSPRLRREKLRDFSTISLLFLFLKEENEGDERFSPCMGLLIPHLKRSRFAPNII